MNLQGFPSNPLTYSHVDDVGFTRSTNDPCIYTMLGGDVVLPLYVDDGRLYYADTSAAKKVVDNAMAKLTERFGIKFGPEDPENDYFLGSNRAVSADRSTVTICMSAYIELMVQRYADGDVSEGKFPAAWGHTPADEGLHKLWEGTMLRREPSSKDMSTRYGSLFGSLLHAVKYRPEIAATMSLLGSCLTFPNDDMYQALMRVLVYLGRSPKIGITFSRHSDQRLRCFADSNWSVTRSTTGYCMMLCGGVISANSHRQHCITMSSTEAELVALADCAIELLFVRALLQDLGLEFAEPIEVCTDNKGAFDLCHRYTSAQNSRHIDRKMFKMRELRGSGDVTVRHIPTDFNPADLFTKVLPRVKFEKFRREVLNTGACAARTSVGH